MKRYVFFQGSIPMRELVYRVQRLPERMVHLVWDFGQLDETNEKDYIQHMVNKEVCFPTLFLHYLYTIYFYTNISDFVDTFLIIQISLYTFSIIL